MMYKYSILLCFCFLVACKEAPKVEAPKMDKTEKALPSYVSAVMDAHGGLDRWNKMTSMSYVMEKSSGDEKQSIDLRDRRELVQTDDYQLGYDGVTYWTTADTSVKVNPVFYKNLIFYFYAMPFVAADDGIVYEEVAPLEFDGVSYPGFKIGFNAGVGVSPEDEYFIHYNPETKQMEWLGYTVTYFSKEKSTKISWRRYDDWVTINELKLPKSMARMVSEENLPIEEKSRVNFKSLKVSQNPFPEKYFAVPAGARLVSE